MHESAPEPPLRVTIAPDSFKGTVSANEAAGYLAAGWLQVRPHDEVRCMAMADGGEGTMAALAAALPEARLIDAAPVAGPLGTPVPARWLRIGTIGLVELAAVAGVGLVGAPSGRSAQQASTDGLGQLIAQVWDAGVDSVVVALGGSASTDGGLGVLRGLGLVARDRDGRVCSGGGADLAAISHLDTTRLRRDTPVLLLTDVTAPLLGSAGAARVFSPQKGADAATVEQLESGLAHWAQLWRHHGVPASLATSPGVGAAGGVAYGLAAGMGASWTSGAAWVAERIGLPAVLAHTDVLITGEGRFDHQSTTGKVVGYLLEQPHPVRRWIVAGQIDPSVTTSAGTVSLSDLAGDAATAYQDPAPWLRAAGALLATNAQATDSAQLANDGRSG